VHAVAVNPRARAASGPSRQGEGKGTVLGSLGNGRRSFLNPARIIGHVIVADPPPRPQSFSDLINSERERETDREGEGER